MSNQLVANPSKIFKERLAKDEFEEDHLPVYTDLPPSQQWQVINYIEHQKSAVQAFEETCMIEFMKQIGERVLKKTVGSENWILFEEKYADFKMINETKLNKIFVEKFGNDYDRYRIWCSFGCYATEKTALKVAEELGKTRGKIHGDFVVIQNGYYVPFKPTPDMCTNQKSTNKIMNDFMRGQVENKIEKNAIFNLRNKTLIQKNMQDAEERGEKLKLKSGEIEKMEKFEQNFERFDPADTIDLSIRKGDVENKKARELINIELQIGHFDLINLELMDRLGYDKETIDMVKIEAEKIRALRKKEREEQAVIDDYINTGQYEKIDISDMKRLHYDDDTIKKVSSSDKNN